MPDEVRIDYDLGARGPNLQSRVWELRGRSWVGAIQFVSVRAITGMLECLQMQVERGRMTIGDREYPYYLPLEALQPGRRSVALYRRLAALVWVGLSERAIELPVAWRFVQERRWTSMLEVGNVLGYWYDVPPHVVVDKYERGGGILNEDIATYVAPERFDLIVSISTLEHIGFDESPRDPAKFLRVVRKLEMMRAPRGRLFFSVPTGYNPAVDRAVLTGELGAYDLRAVVSDPGRGQRFREVPVLEAVNRPHGIVFASLG